MQPQEFIIKIKSQYLSPKNKWTKKNRETHGRFRQAGSPLNFESAVSNLRSMNNVTTWSCPILIKERESAVSVHKIVY